MKPVYYDALLKDLFQHYRPSLLNELTGGVAIREVLNVELPLVQEWRADLLLSLADETILHIEFQSENHRHMPHRIGIYGLLVGMHYARPIRQVVIYVGDRKLRMANRLELGGITVEYRLLDIRDLDARDMLRSGRPEDCVLALLTGNGAKMLREIVSRTNEIEGPERDLALAQLAALAGLRQLSERLRMVYEAMGIAIDIEKNVILKDILLKGRAEGIVEGRIEGKVEGKAEGKAEALMGLLRDKFKRVPKWAQQRIADSTPERLDFWFKKILTGKTIEDVLGPR